MNSQLMGDFVVTLRMRMDELKVVRYATKEIAEELEAEVDKIDEMLRELYTQGELVYLTRVNKETGEEIKVVQFIE